MTIKNTISRDEFESIDIRIGTIIQVEEFPQMKKPSYKLIIDLWEIGIKHSSSQLASQYKKEELINKQVLCICNFPPKQMPWWFISEVLTTWIVVEDGSVILVSPDKQVSNWLQLS